jgi:hypothetical protein
MMEIQGHPRRETSRHTAVVPVLPGLIRVVLIAMVALVIPVSEGAHGQTGAAPGSWRPVNPFPDDEAPPYLLDLDVGDTEVELFMLGSWTATSEVTFGFALHPPLPDSGSRVTWGYPFPDFETNFFAQTVDLTVSLWLYQRYFFEASFADDSDVNSIAAGYFAAEDELVREFVVGNVPLAVARYPYQYSGNTGSRAGNKPNPGTVLRLQTDTTFHEFLVQLENSTEERLRISGGRIVEETRIRPEDYLRGRAFVLPDRNVTKVELFLQDDNGSFTGRSPGDDRLRRYRRLDDSAGDYVVDLAAGTVRLAESVPGRRLLAVYYETSAGPVGASGNGADGLVALDQDTAAPTTGSVDFSFGATTLFDLIDTEADYDGTDFRLDLSDGRDALILRAPGLWSPFEAANLYRLPDNAGEDARFRLVRRYTSTPADSDIQLRRIAGTSLLQAVRGGATSGDPGFRYPWAEESPLDVHSRIYGPRSTPEAGLSTSDIAVEYGYTADSIRLTGDIVPGSVAVRSGGQAVSGATVDYDSGTIELPREVTGAGTVDITYRVYGEDGDSTDLVVINGNRWTPSPDMDVSVATGLRWTLTDNSYSTELNQHPGQITLSSGVNWQGENLRLEAAGAAQLSQSDTTGHMRLFGGAAQDVTLKPTAETVFPPRPVPNSALPTRATDYTDGIDGANEPDLTAANFVYPRYRDYWSSDALGNISLGTYPSLPEADTDRTNARMGPYLARSSDDGYSGSVAVVEWDSLPEGTWTGGRINRDGEELDLRDAVSILVTYRYIDDGGTGADAPAILLEMGSLGEDLDNDGTLDRGNSAVDPLLPFNGAGGLRRAGQDAPGLARPHSEDTNRNGVLDPEPPSAVFSHLLTKNDTNEVADAGKGWRTVEIPLDDPTHRSRLGAVRAARIVAAAPAGSDVPAGRVLVGEIRVRRSRSVTVTDTGANNTAVASVVPDPEPAGGSLRSRFDVVGSRFVPEADDQRVLSLSWDNEGVSGDTEEAAAEFPISDFSTRAYGTLRGYFFLDVPVTAPADATAGSVILRLEPYRNAPDRERVTVILPADALTGRWHEVSVDLEAEEVRIDGSRVSGADVTVGSRSDRELLRLATLEVRGIGTDAGEIGTGTLYFDELHAADPRTGFALAGRVRADWSRTLERGFLAGAEVYLSQTVAAQGEDFQAAGSATGEEVSAGTGGGAGGGGDGGGGSGASMPPGSGAVATESRGGIRSGSLHLEGEVIARESENDGAAAFGHYIQLPLAPADSVVVRERFFRDYRLGYTGFSREAGLTVSPKRWGRYQIDTGHSLSVTEARQSWRMDLSPPAAGPIGLSLNTTASLFAPDVTISPGTYGDSWQASNEYLLPLAQSVSVQERRQDSRLRLDAGPVEISSSIGWTNRSSLSGDQESRMSWDAALPLSFTPAQRRPWRITPSYRRSYTFAEEALSEDFTEDSRIWADRITAEPVIFTAPPLTELFRPAGPRSFGSFQSNELNRGYDGEGRIRFNRAFSSRLSDLWTPSDVELLVRRSLRWEAATLEDSRLWQAGVTAIAVNLFGTDGARSRYSFYKSDEFRNSVILALQEYPNTTGVRRWTIGLEQGSSFFGEGDNRFDVTNTLDFSGGETTELEYGNVLGYVWERPGYPPLRIFERMEEKPFYRHEETLTTTITAVEGTFTGSEVALGHRTRLVITQQGSISAYGDIGWIADPGEYEDGALHLIGLRFGIEGRLAY